jgi:BirA family transcriptional regulator, biotin operon repressor / biotin---[acetyl-CoA-carboxylase] ligase
MTATAIPEILSQLAQAGAAGISLHLPTAARDLELCREWGYKLTSNDGRTYLQFDQDSLVPFWIETEAGAAAWSHMAVSGFFELGSTNDEALARARAGAPEGHLVFAEMQTAGRGRIGRKWISSPRVGLYFSLILRPQCQQKFWPLLTHAVSVALNRTLRDLRTGGFLNRELSIDLKWPNDVLIAGKKIAGILLETAGKEAAIVGIGINVSTGSVPEQMKEQATSISEEANCSIPRRWLLIRFLKNFRTWYDIFEGGDYEAILDQWKEYSSMWENAPVWVQQGGQRRAAVTCGLSETGGLKIQTEQGKQEILLAGDVTLRRF